MFAQVLFLAWVARLASRIELVAFGQACRLRRLSGRVSWAKDVWAWEFVHEWLDVARETQTAEQDRPHG